jgi:hypothetical protein
MLSSWRRMADDDDDGKIEMESELLMDISLV